MLVLLLEVSVFEQTGLPTPEVGVLGQEVGVHDNKGELLLLWGMASDSKQGTGSRGLRMSES
jgi:hypothetical protein